MKTSEYASHDALGLAALVASGEISALELVETAIAAITDLNPTLNAVIHESYERARDAYRAALQARDELAAIQELSASDARILGEIESSLAECEAALAGR